MADSIVSSSALVPAGWQVMRAVPPVRAGHIQLWRLHVPAVAESAPAARASHDPVWPASFSNSAPFSNNVAENAYARLEDEGARLEGLMTDDERGRWARYRRADDRRRFARARGLLRTLLAAQLGMPASALTFVLGHSGKPALPPGPDKRPARVRFNVSHSHEWILIGLTLDRELGVDVEHYHPRGELLELARRFFSAAEVAALEAMPPATRDAAFYATWACKEAFLKASGEGLTAGLDCFSVLGAAEGRHETMLRWEEGRVQEEPRGAGREEKRPRGMAGLGEPSDWTIRLLDIGPDYAAAVAVEGPPPRLECFEWR